jgi:predicted secreted hydrolase
MHRTFPHNNIFSLLMLILLLSLAARGSEGKSSTILARPPGLLAHAFQSHLLLVKDAVAAIVNPITGEPTVIPDFDLLFKAAGRLDSRQNPGKDVATVLALLGRASDFGSEAPGADYPLQFPKDHHLHPTMGFEWYYVCFHLNVTDADGTRGRIGVLLSMQKQRVIGLSTQQRLGWSDEGSLLFVNLATATVDLPGRKALTRRSENLQWPAAGGSARYSAPGEAFYIQCGPDILSGTMDVLPLFVSVQDGTNLAFSLTLHPPDGFMPANAFFLQGVPTVLGGGTGLTYLPTPGIYYSWPQLVVDTGAPASIVVDGVSYTINSGRGWIDHQVMMQSLRNPGDATSPVPFTDDAKPFNGWSWQFFHLENGDAFTGAAFHQWYLSTNPAFNYGYYVVADRASGKWIALFITGEMVLGDFKSFPVSMAAPSSSSTLQLPTSWKYVNIQSPLGDPLEGAATPWFTDGTFDGQALQIISENPVDYKDTSGRYPDGVGFCESVGFERSDGYRNRALDFLNRRKDLERKLGEQWGRP